MISSDIPEIERLADAAWPAAEQVALGPWTLRATGGVTHRANSVFAVPRGPVPVDIAPLIEAAERFYDARGLWTVFHISPAVLPRDLDAILDARGYATESPSEVWTADAAEVAQRTGEAGAGEVRRTARPDTAWFDCAYQEPEPRRSIHEGIVLRIAQPALFVSVREGPVAVACGFGVSGGGHAGVFSMVTRAEHRGRGLAARVLHALAQWACERGDARLYLQVGGSNAPAHAVYGRVGFAFAYPYRYRVRKPELPAGGPV
ncbi:MAG TPA: GNAT family N-acetyltransferase [Candidatus Limnocylindria bacterium]|nr:GNAT family N-acetyltransferase [Candidatus Limnocylindria bacterium]